MARKTPATLDGHASLPAADEMMIGIAVSEWNRDLNDMILAAAVRTLRAAGCAEYNIRIKYFPGTLELGAGTVFFAEYTDVDAVILIGTSIRNDALWLPDTLQTLLSTAMHVQTQWIMPVIPAIMECDSRMEAAALCQMDHNRGELAARQAVELVRIQLDMEAASPNTNDTQVYN